MVAFVIIALVYIGNMRNSAQRMPVQNQAPQSMQDTDRQPTMEMMTRIQELKDAYEQNPGDFRTNRELADNYFDISRFDKAVFHYRKALKVQADVPDVLIDLGVSYFNLNKADSAVYYVKKALELNPQHAQGQYNLGIIYYNMQQPQKAVQVWQRLVKQNPQAEEARMAKELIKQVEQQLNKS